MNSIRLRRRRYHVHRTIGRTLAVCVSVPCLLGAMRTSAKAHKRGDIYYHWCSVLFHGGDGNDHLVITDRTLMESHDADMGERIETAMLEQFRAQIERQFSRSFPEATCSHYGTDGIQAESDRSQLQLRFLASHPRRSDLISKVTFTFVAPGSQQ